MPLIRLSFMDQWNTTEDIQDPETTDPTPETQAPQTTETPTDASVT